MIPRSRFQFGDPAPRDSEIVRRATGLRIDLWKDKDGDCHGDVKITCSFGLFGKDTILSDEDHQEHQREAMRFIRELITSFEQRPEDGMAATG